MLLTLYLSQIALTLYFPFASMLQSHLVSLKDCYCCICQI